MSRQPDEYEFIKVVVRTRYGTIWHKTCELVAHRATSSASDRTISSPWGLGVKNFQGVGSVGPWPPCLETPHWAVQATFKLCGPRILQALLQRPWPTCYGVFELTGYG